MRGVISQRGHSVRGHSYFVTVSVLTEFVSPCGVVWCSVVILWFLPVSCCVVW